MTSQRIDSTAGNLCPYCMKEVEPFYVEMGGKKYHVANKACECEGAMKAAEEQLKREKQEEERHLKIRFQKAGVTPRYMEAETDKALKSYYITGPIGTGKTHLACALVKEACKCYRKAQITSSVDIVSMIHSTYSRESQHTEDGIISKLSSVEVLVIDDLGKEKPTESTKALLYRIIDNRYQNKSITIVTSNYERDELASRLGGDMTAQAIVSRLSDLERIYLGGKDRRLGS